MPLLHSGQLDEPAARRGAARGGSGGQDVHESIQGSLRARGGDESSCHLATCSDLLRKLGFGKQTASRYIRAFQNKITDLGLIHGNRKKIGIVNDTDIVLDSSAKKPLQARGGAWSDHDLVPFGPRFPPGARGNRLFSEARLRRLWWPQITTGSDRPSRIRAKVLLPAPVGATDQESCPSNGYEFPPRARGGDPSPFKLGMSSKFSCPRPRVCPCIPRATAIR